MDIQLVSEKIGEVKALFVLAQRILPFMEDLFNFVSEVTPVLEDVNKEILENLDKMPNASKQLAKVTEANETATTEILDTVDRLTNELISIGSELDKLKEIDRNRLHNSTTLLKTITDAINEEKDLKTFLPEINEFLDRMTSSVIDEHIELIDNIANRLSDIINDANNIIMALQVQDITAQQLAAVNNLIETIQIRLAKIMKNLSQDVENNQRTVQDSEKYDETLKVSRLHKNIAFDPEAIEAISNQSARQDSIDDIINANNENMSSDETDNQENHIESNTQSAEDSFEEFSQDDIDALFGDVK